MNLQVKSIMHRLLPIKGFRYVGARWGELCDGVIEILIEPRKNSKGCCSGCGKPGPGYDRLPERSWRFPPLWGVPVFLAYRARRIDCSDCGVRVERVPWATGRFHIADAFRLLISQWARRLSWQEVAELFYLNWNDVYMSLKWVVGYGLEHRSLQGIKAIGVDEIKVHRRRDFRTLVYQIDEDCRRLLWIGRDRTAACVGEFLDGLEESVRQGIRFVCSDMWKPYLKAVREKLPAALHILDRFHIRKLQNEAVDQVRREEARAMAEAGLDPLLKNMRWAFVKNRRNWTPGERLRIRRLSRANLRSFRAFVLVESFQHFREFVSPTWAGKFLDDWCRRVARSRLDPLKKTARSLKEHRELLLNYFRAKRAYSSGAVEGFNNKVKLTIRKSYGFRTDDALEIALYHALGKLPEPEFTHSFF